MPALEDVPLTFGLETFLFLQEEKKKFLLYTWEGSSFKLTTDCFLKTQIYFEIERASGAFG